MKVTPVFRTLVAILLALAALGSLFLENQARLAILAMLAVLIFMVWSRRHP